MAVIGPHGWIIGEILLQEPGSQFPCERAGPTFPLHEGDGRWILAAVEIEIEGGSCLVKPLLAKLLAARRCGAWMLLHGCLPEKRDRLSHYLGYPMPAAQLQ